MRSPSHPHAPPSGDPPFALPVDGPLPAHTAVEVVAHTLTHCRQARATRACERLRRLAAPRLAAGVSLEAAAQSIGVSPARLTAAHATVFDAAQSPLKARRLDPPAPVLRAVLAAAAQVQWQRPGRHLVLAGARLALHTSSGLQAYAVQADQLAPRVLWFNRAGDIEWAWLPGEQQGAMLASLLRTWGSRDLRAKLPAPGDAGTTLDAQAQATRLLPPGAAWDLLLHAAATGLPLAVHAGGSAALGWHGTLHRASLDGHRLRVLADGLQLSLAETAPVHLGPAGAGLSLGIGAGASRAQVCAWEHIVDAVGQGRSVAACTC